LRCDDWAAALRDLEGDPEFAIARALASVRGHEKQPDGTYSEVEPFLGSLVPLRRLQNKWYLPDVPSAQAVWTGIDLTRDLASVLARRVLDSANDVRPAVVGVCTVRLSTILRFLWGELDERRIAKLLQALSLIEWRFQPRRAENNASAVSADESLDPQPIPIAYAAVRSLLEVACDSTATKNRRTTKASGPRTAVQRTIALVSRQEARMVASATTEALRRLAVVGVPNPYGDESQREKPRLAGHDVIRIDTSLDIDFELARRVAAAALIPLDWRDRWNLYRAITLPQVIS
jgi:CRISPR-associated protein Csx17